MTLLSYKGHLGSVEFDQEERLLFGKLQHIRALVSYEATGADGLVRAFEEAVDDYLEQCREQGAAPETPLKGSFNVRIGPDLHRRAVVAASHAGISLNAFVTRALEAAVERTSERAESRLEEV